MSERPLRLLRVITWLPVGGIERRLVSVLPRLATRGYEPKLVCIREPGPLAAELQKAGIPVDVIPFRSRMDMRGLRLLGETMREWKADVVHSHMYRSNVPATIAAHRADVPVVFAQVHNIDTWESWRQATVDRFVTRWRTGVICVSKAVQEDVCDRLSIGKERAPILYNGCDTDTFRPNEELRIAVRRELGLAPDHVMILVPARVHEQKNPIAVLDAFLEARQGVAANSRLVFAGDGPMLNDLKKAVDHAAVRGQVTTLGRRDDMPALYNAADVVLLSSRKEGFSNAVVEALACGKPVIAANVGGNREAVDSPAVGWIHEPGDNEALRNQLRSALSDPARLATMSADCRKRGERFSLAKLIDETDALYREALEKASRGVQTK